MRLVTLGVVGRMARNCVRPLWMPEGVSRCLPHESMKQQTLMARSRGCHFTTPQFACSRHHWHFAALEELSSPGSSINWSVGKHSGNSDVARLGGARSRQADTSAKWTMGVTETLDHQEDHGACIQTSGLVDLILRRLARL